MSHRIITIEREYASGGREIGEMIAERLGIPCYNREILQMASERCNVSMDYLETAEEAAPKSFLYTLMLTSSPTRTIEENLPLSDKVYIIETNIIRELAEKGDYVIVGRCASYILRDLENLPFVCMSRGTSTYSQETTGCNRSWHGAASPLLRIESHTLFSSAFIVGKKRNITSNPKIPAVGI